MNKRIFLQNTFIISLLLLLLLSNSICSGEAKQSAAKIIEKVVTAYKNIQSYSFINEQIDLDNPVSEREKKAGDSYSKDASRIPGAKTELEKIKKEEPQNKDNRIYRKGTYKYKFLKPFDIQSEVVESDYVPAIINKSLLTYRPSKNKDKFYFKARLLPFAVPRSIKDDVGDVFLMHWTYEIEELKMIKRVGQAELLEDETIDESHCYVVSIKIAPKTEIPLPELAKENPDIPDEMIKEFNFRLNTYNTAYIDEVRYWIDKSDFFIRKKERYAHGKMLHSRHFKDIKINSLSEKDF